MTDEDKKTTLSFLIAEMEAAVHKLDDALMFNHSAPTFPGASLVLWTFSEILMILKRIEDDISRALPSIKKMREPEILSTEFESTSKLMAHFSLDVKILYEWTNHVFRIVGGHPEWGSFHKKYKSDLKPFEIIRSKMLTHFPENDLYKSGRGLAGHGWKYRGDDLEGIEMIWSISRYEPEVIAELRSLQSELSKSMSEFQSLESSDEIVNVMCQKLDHLNDRKLQSRADKLLQRVTIVAKSPRDLAVVLRSFILEFVDLASSVLCPAESARPVP